MDNQNLVEKGLGAKTTSNPSIPKISIEGPSNGTANDDAELIQDTQDNQDNANEHAKAKANSRPGLLSLATAPITRKRKSNTLPQNSTTTPTFKRHHTAPAGTTADGDVAPDTFNWRTLLRPEHPVSSKSPSLTTCFRNIVMYSYLNVLLVFIPIGWGMHFAHQSDTLIFVFTFIAVIPLAALLGFATEELALRVGPTLGKTIIL